VVLRRLVVLRGGGERGGPAGPGQAGPVRAGRRTRLPVAALVRRGGYLAWASDERDGPARATATRAAVHWWCG
jgi:hypothetical protein